jgi:hypothetical protein
MTERATLRARSALPRRLCASGVVDGGGSCEWRRRRGCWSLMSSYTCATSLTAASRSATQAIYRFYLLFSSCWIYMED